MGRPHGRIQHAGISSPKARPFFLRKGQAMALAKPRRQRNRHPRPHTPPGYNFPLQPITAAHVIGQPAKLLITWNQNVVAQPPGGFGFKLVTPDLPDQTSQAIVQISSIETMETFESEIFDPASFEDANATTEVIPFSGIAIRPFNPVFVTPATAFALLMVSATKVQDDPTVVRVVFNQVVTALPARAEFMHLDNGLLFSQGAVDVTQVDAITCDFEYSEDVPGIAGWTIQQDTPPPGVTSHYGLYTYLQTISVDIP